MFKLSLLSVQGDPSLAPQDCLTSVVNRFSVLGSDEVIQKDVLEILNKKESLLRMMRKAREIGNEIVPHFKTIELSEGQKIAKEMQTEMAELIKVHPVLLSIF
jgi:hypothetical protein